MLLYLLLLFTLVPLTEFMLLYWIGEQIGLLPTIILVLGTGILGASLARRQGVATLDRLRGELAQGAMPADAIFDGVLIFVAAALLVTPGVLTDAFGFALLVPPFRAMLKKLLRRRFASRIQTHILTQAWTNSPPPSDRIIDVEVIETRTSDA